MTPAQTEELAKPLVRLVYFVEFDFLGGTARASTFNSNITWNGHVWLGVGAMSSIGEVTEAGGTTAQALDFTLNPANRELLALAIGPVEEYRGRRAKMWMCPLDEKYRLLGDPMLCWRGIMDTVALGVGKESGSITLRCETSAYGLKRQNKLRMNAAQQKHKYPDDTGFDKVAGLISNQTLWLSKKFQAQ